MKLNLKRDFKMLLKTYPIVNKKNISAAKAEMSSQYVFQTNSPHDTFQKSAKAPTFGMTVTPFCKEISNSNIYFKYEIGVAKCIKSINFKSPLNICEALSEIILIGKTRTEKFYNTKTITEFHNAVKKEDFKKDKKVIGAEAGAETLALELDNKTVLKLSYVPNYPDECRLFDLPVLEKGKIPNSATFYYIQPKADTENVTLQHLEEVIQDIENAGYNAIDLLLDEAYLSQIGLYNGKAYLLDPDCAYKL